MKNFILPILTIIATGGLIRANAQQPGTKEWRNYNIENGEIMQQPGINIEKEYYNNGKVKLEGPMKEMEVIDTITLYDQYGNFESKKIVKERKTVRDGNWTLYDENGIKKATIIYKKGEPVDTLDN